jgi:hypothetical protein
VLGKYEWTWCPWLGWLTGHRDRSNGGFSDNRDRGALCDNCLRGSARNWSSNLWWCLGLWRWWWSLWFRTAFGPNRFDARDKVDKGKVQVVADFGIFDTLVDELVCGLWVLSGVQKASKSKAKKKRKNRQRKK